MREERVDSAWRAGGASRRRRLLLFDGFFRGQGVLLLRLRLLQLRLVEAGHLRDVGLVAHGCSVSELDLSAGSL